MDERLDENLDEGGRKPLSRPATLFLLTMAVVLAVAALAAYRNGTGFDVLRRYFHYGDARRADSEIRYEYELSGKNRFAAVGDYLAVLSDTSFRLLDSAGGELWSQSVRMESPALEQGGGRVVAYDVGGTELYVADESGVLLTLTAEEDEPFLAARLNRNGYLAVTAGAKGLRGLVRVYDDHFETMFDFNSAERFVCDACVTDDGRYLAAVTLGQDGGVFVSDVVFYRLDQEEPYAECPFPGQLAAGIGQQGSSLAVVTDGSLAFVDTDGTVRARRDYPNEYLRGYSLSGDGFAALLLNRYQSGSVARLVTVDGGGRELGSLDVREEVLSLSAAGRYVAVLYANRLAVYNQYLQEYAVLENTDSLRQVMMRSDGSVMTLGGTSAGLYLP